MARRNSDMSDLNEPPIPHYESAPESDEELGSPKVDAHLDDDEGYPHDPTASSRSSPPTSIDQKHAVGGSARSSLSSAGVNDTIRGHRQRGSDESYRLPSISLSQFSPGIGEGDSEATYRYRAQSPGESQWDSDGPRQKPTDGRKSANPSAKVYPRSAHAGTSAPRMHLNPATRRSTDYYTSRASSVSYGATTESGKKAPLVLLHLSILLLPGAEEPILRKITPTMLERGMLIEHPRSDFQLLEELIFDALGLDDALEPDFEKIDDNDPSAWEKSMGVHRIAGRNRWELRVYAANGLMTPGAWRRVWSEMERIDVEVGPKDWRGEKTEELIQNFARFSGGKDAEEPATPSSNGTTEENSVGKKMSGAKEVMEKMAVLLRENYKGVCAVLGALVVAVAVSAALYYGMGANQWTLNSEVDIDIGEDVYGIQIEETLGGTVSEIIDITETPVAELEAVEELKERSEEEPVYCDNEAEEPIYCPEDPVAVPEEAATQESAETPENAETAEAAAPLEEGEVISPAPLDAESTDPEIHDPLAPVENTDSEAPLPEADTEAATPETAPEAAAEPAKKPFGQRSCIPRPKPEPTLEVQEEKISTSAPTDTPEVEPETPELSTETPDLNTETPDVNTENPDLDAASASPLIAESESESVNLQEQKVEDDDLELETSIFEEEPVKGSWWDKLLV